MARCEVSQLTESPRFPTMAAMVRPFVPSEVVARYESMRERSLGTKMIEEDVKELFCISVFAMLIAHL